MNEEQVTRLGEVLQHQDLAKEMGLTEKQMQTKYLADINVTLALIFDELRAANKKNVQVATEQPVRLEEVENA